MNIGFDDTRKEICYNVFAQHLEADEETRLDTEMWRPIIRQEFKDFVINHGSNQSDLYRPCGQWVASWPTAGNGRIHLFSTKEACQEFLMNNHLLTWFEPVAIIGIRVDWIKELFQDNGEYPIRK